MHCSFWHFKYTSHCSNSFIISGKIKKHFGCYYNISSTLEYYWLDNNILIIFGMPLHYLLFQFLPPLNTRFLKKFWAEKKKAIEEVPRRKGFFTFLLIQFKNNKPTERTYIINTSIVIYDNGIIQYWLFHYYFTISQYWLVQA